MRQSQLFTATRKEFPKDETSTNAQLLIRGGFVDKLIAGVYTYLPFGLRVLNKIQNIIREEMNALGAQEILMPALTPKDPWAITGRWDEIDVLFKFEGAEGKEYALGSTHEEVVTPLVQKFVQSYKNLPVAVYQIQDKFRDEPRAKSGLLRGREFSMKDLYSFHTSEADLEAYYERVKAIYTRIFERCGLASLVVEASGGVFSKFSHEFQVLTPYGEDIVYVCDGCGRHQNRELVVEGDLKCPSCSNKRHAEKAIEVGNIFKLKTKFTKAFHFTFVDENGKEQEVIMGCYGIGPSRVMGAAVEVHHDAAGIIWPASIAPFAVHLVSLCQEEGDIREAEKVYQRLLDHGVEVLYDDRPGVRAGAKFADADLIGIPKRIVVSPKTLEEKSVEVKMRGEKEGKLIKITEM